MWKLIIADDQHQKTVVNLVREDYSIGRSEGHAVRLTERNVSRDHAQITRSQTGYRLEDLSSYNGIYVNGVRLVGRQDLAHGDLIQLGDYRVQVIDETIDTREQGYRLISGEQGPTSSSRLPHRLVELIGPQQGREHVLEGERFLLGRGSECEFTIDHSSVSRIHAEVRALGNDKFELLDKGSANGLRVNGHELERTILDSRDVIELGDVVLKYIPHGLVFKADAAEGLRIASMAGSSLPPASDKKARNGIFSTLFAAGFGAVLVLALALSLLTRNEADSSEPPALPDELAGAAQLLDEGDLRGAEIKLNDVPGAARALVAYSELEEKWALAILDDKSFAKNEIEKRELLNLVAKKASLRPALREAALKKIASLSDDAIDLTALEGDEF